MDSGPIASVLDYARKHLMYTEAALALLEANPFDSVLTATAGKDNFSFRRDIDYWKTTVAKLSGDTPPSEDECRVIMARPIRDIVADYRENNAKYDAIVSSPEFETVHDDIPDVWMVTDSADYVGSQVQGMLRIHLFPTEKKAELFASAARLCSSGDVEVVRVIGGYIDFV